MPKLPTLLLLSALSALAFSRRVSYCGMIPIWVPYRTSGIGFVMFMYFSYITPGLASRNFFSTYLHLKL